MSAALALYGDLLEAPARGEGLRLADGRLERLALKRWLGPTTRADELSGFEYEGYASRWLLVTGLLFAGSALLYGLRVRRAAAGGSKT